jgi:hypothetical protein
MLQGRIRIQALVELLNSIVADFNVKEIKKSQTFVELESFLAQIINSLIAYRIDR